MKIQNPVLLSIFASFLFMNLSNAMEEQKPAEQEQGRVLVRPAGRKVWTKEDDQRLAADYRAHQKLMRENAQQRRARRDAEAVQRAERRAQIADKIEHGFKSRAGRAIVRNAPNAAAVAAGAGAALGNAEMQPGQDNAIGNVNHEEVNLNQSFLTLELEEHDEAPQIAIDGAMPLNNSQEPADMAAAVAGVSGIDQGEMVVHVENGPREQQQEQHEQLEPGAQRADDSEDSKSAPVINDNKNSKLSDVSQNSNLKPFLAVMAVAAGTCVKYGSKITDAIKSRWFNAVANVDISKKQWLKNLVKFSETLSEEEHKKDSTTKLLVEALSNPCIFKDAKNKDFMNSLNKDQKELIDLIISQYKKETDKII